MQQSDWTVRHTDRKEVRTLYFRYLILTVCRHGGPQLLLSGGCLLCRHGTGENGLAALNVALPIFTIYTTVSVSIGVGASTTISILRGSGETKEQDKVFTQAFLLTLLIGILFSAVGTFFLGELADFFGTTPLIRQSVIDYLQPISIGSFIYLLSSALSIIVRGDGNPRLVMVAGTVGNLTNIALDYVFVMRMGMGIFGAGLATIIGPCVTAGFLSLHFSFKSAMKSALPGVFFPKLLARTLKNGLGFRRAGDFLRRGDSAFQPRAAARRRRGGGGRVFHHFQHRLRRQGIFGGMAQAAQPIISVSFGAGWLGRMRLVNRYALVTSAVFSLVVYGVLWLFPGSIIGAFVSPSPEILEMGIPAVLLYFSSLPFTGLNTVLMYYFQSTEHVKLSACIAALRGWCWWRRRSSCFPPGGGLPACGFPCWRPRRSPFLIFYPLSLPATDGCCKRAGGRPTGNGSLQKRRRTNEQPYKNTKDLSGRIERKKQKYLLFVLGYSIMKKETIRPKRGAPANRAARRINAIWEE